MSLFKANPAKRDNWRENWFCFKKFSKRPLDNP